MPPPISAFTHCNVASPSPAAAAASSSSGLLIFDPAFKLFGQSIPVSSTKFDDDERSATTTDDSHCTQVEEELDIDARDKTSTRDSRSRVHTTTASSRYTSDNEELGDEELGDEGTTMMPTTTTGKCRESHGEVENDGTGEEDSVPTSAICMANYVEEAMCKDNGVREESKREEMEEENMKEEEILNSEGDGQVAIRKPDKSIACPRCESMDTKFCYYNNYNVNQPRHFCKGCQRYWTAGGTLRNVPVGAGRRKNKQHSSSSTSILCNLSRSDNDPPPSSASCAATTASVAACAATTASATALHSVSAPYLYSSRSCLISNNGSDSSICSTDPAAPSSSSNCTVNNLSSGCRSSQLDAVDCASRGNPAVAAGRIGDDEKINGHNINGYGGPEAVAMAGYSNEVSAFKSNTQSAALQTTQPLCVNSNYDLHSNAIAMAAAQHPPSTNTINGTFPFLINYNSAAAAAAAPWPIFGHGHSSSSLSTPSTNLLPPPHSESATVNAAAFLPQIHNTWPLGMPSSTPWPLVPGALWPLPYCTAMWAMQWAAAAAAAAAMSSAPATSVGGISSPSFCLPTEPLADGSKQGASKRRREEFEEEKEDNMKVEEVVEDRRWRSRSDGGGGESGKLVVPKTVRIGEKEAEGRRSIWGRVAERDRSGGGGEAATGVAAAAEEAEGLCRRRRIMFGDLMRNAIHKKEAADLNFQNNNNHNHNNNPAAASRSCSFQERNTSSLPIQ